MGLSKKQALQAAIADTKQTLHSRTGSDLSARGQQVLRDRLVKLNRLSGKD